MISDWNTIKKTWTTSHAKGMADYVPLQDFIISKIFEDAYKNPTVENLESAEEAFRKLGITMEQKRVGGQLLTSPVDILLKAKESKLEELTGPVTFFENIRGSITSKDLQKLDPLVLREKAWQKQAKQRIGQKRSSFEKAWGRYQRKMNLLSNLQGPQLQKIPIKELKVSFLKPQIKEIKEKGVLPRLIQDDFEKIFSEQAAITRAKKRTKTP